MSDEHPEQIEMAEDDDLSAEAIHAALQEAELQRILEASGGR